MTLSRSRGRRQRQRPLTAEDQTKIALYRRDPVLFVQEELGHEPSMDQAKLLRAVADTEMKYIIICAGRGCLKHGTLIQMSDGSYKHIENIKVGDKVVSTNDGTHMIPKKVIGVYNRGKKKVHRFRNSTGGEISCTDDHLFLTNAKKKNKWQPAKYFKQYKDRTLKSIKLQAGNYDVKDYPITDNKLTLLARLISEGYYVSTPKVTNNDRKFLEECEQIVQQEFDMSCKYYPKGNGWDLIISNDYKDSRPVKGTSRGSPSSEIIKWLKTIEIYGQKKEFKRVPEFMFKCSNRQIRLFIDNFQLGDGNVYVRKGKRAGQLLTTLYPGVAKGLADDLRLLYNRLGVFPNIKERHGQYEVYLADKKSRQYMNNEHPTATYGLFKECTGEHETWDIEVESGEPCFLTNGGFIAHNSGKTMVVSWIVAWNEAVLVDYYPKYETYVLGGSLEQSKRLYEYFRGYVHAVPTLDKRLTDDPTMRETRFKRGKVQALAASSKQVRGPHVECLIIDEVCEADPMIIADSLSMITGSHHGRLIMLSTPHRFFGIFQDRWEDPEKYKMHKFGPWSLYDCPWIDQDYLKILKASFTPDRIAYDIEGKFPTFGKLMFPKDWIEDCIAAKPFTLNPNYDMNIGVDWGDTLAKTSMVPVQFYDNKIRIPGPDHIWEDIPHTMIIDEVATFSRIYRGRLALCDSAQRGTNDFLEKTGALEVERIYFGQDKGKMQVNLQTLLYKREIEISPNCTILLDELRRYRQREYGKPKPKNQDCVDALMAGTFPYADIEILQKSSIADRFMTL